MFWDDTSRSLSIEENDCSSAVAAVRSVGKALDAPAARKPLGRGIRRISGRANSRVTEGSALAQLETSR
jgi:hypothetical protein